MPGRIDPSSRIHDRGDCLEVTLSQGLITTVDHTDRDIVEQCVWFAQCRRPRKEYRGRYYAVSHLHSQNNLTQLHRAILGITDPKVQVDHIDGDSLNNRRSNLRVATNCENMRNRGPQSNNRTRYKGVYQDGNIFIAQIKPSPDKPRMYLGSYPTAELAAAAYDRAAETYHGLFAKHNNMDRRTRITSAEIDLLRRMFGKTVKIGKENLSYAA